MPETPSSWTRPFINISKSCFEITNVEEDTSMKFPEPIHMRVVSKWLMRKTIKYRNTIDAVTMHLIFHLYCRPPTEYCCNIIYYIIIPEGSGESVGSLTHSLTLRSEEISGDHRST